jgi:hypothetical protein
LRGGPGHKGHAVNDHIAKLETKLAGIVAEQKAALVAAEADGVTDDDRAKHLAEFDRLDGEKAKAKASLERAKRVSADESAAAATGPSRRGSPPSWTWPRPSRRSSPPRSAAR